MKGPDIDDPDLTVREIMKHWPGTVTVFLRHNMLCVGCLVAPLHTLSDVCLEYGLNEDGFRRELLAAMAL